jgi:hypothetical protein
VACANMYDSSVFISACIGNLIYNIGFYYFFYCFEARNKPKYRL